MTNPSIANVIRAAEKVVSVSWKEAYEDRKEELSRMFAEFGDRAYGVLIQQFMEPVFERIRAEGYVVKGGFNRTDSVENWGPPEERERCVWYVVKDGEGVPLGTMVLQVYHSHRAFHCPRAPRLFALEAVERETIIAALSSSSSRVRWDIPDERLPMPSDALAVDTRWEYATDVALADCLRGAGDGQMHSWSLDEALSHWGRYGWELVTVMPSGGTVIAFFKRPRKAE